MIPEVQSAVTSAPQLAGLNTKDPKAVAAKVQSMFLEVMLKSMEDGVGSEGGGLFGSGPGADIYGGMFREQLAAKVGSQMGGSLENQLIQGMSNTSVPSTPAIAAAPASSSTPAAAAASAVVGSTFYPRPPRLVAAAAVAVSGAVSGASAAAEGLPVKGVVTSEKGWRRDPISGETQFHAGIDVAAPAGTSIKAVAAGRVIESGVKGGYGNAVVIATDDGRRMLYGHNSQNFVRVGDRVAAGDAIAAVGSTGHATGPHVHFEVSEK